METATAEVDIDRPAADVWAIVGDFGGLAFLPGVDSVTVDGDVRTVGMGTMEVKEKLIARDDATRSITYSIIDGPMPIDHHEATITVTPQAEAAHVTWSVSTEPDEGAAFLRDIYQGALDAVKQRLEG